MRVLANLFADFLQVMVQAEITPDECLVHSSELQQPTTLTNFQGMVTDNTVPPVAPLIPTENLPTTQRHIQIERTRIKIQLYRLQKSTSHGDVSRQAFPRPNLCNNLRRKLLQRFGRGKACRLTSPWLVDFWSRYS